MLKVWYYYKRMYRNSYTGSEVQSYYWTSDTDYIPLSQVRMLITGDEIIFRNVKFYPYAMNRQVIYTDMGIYKDEPSDSRYDFGYYFGNYPSYSGTDVCSKFLSFSSS